MSKRNGDKARSNRQQKRKLLQRKRSRDERKKLEGKTAGVESPSPAGDGKQVVSSRLRQVAGESKSEPGAYEVVLSYDPSSRQQ